MVFLYLLSKREFPQKVPVWFLILLPMDSPFQGNRFWFSEVWTQPPTDGTPGLHLVLTFKMRFLIPSLGLSLIHI